MMKIYRVDMLEYPSCILGKYKIVRKNETNTVRVFLILQNIFYEYDKTAFALGSR